MHQVETCALVGLVPPPSQFFITCTMEK